ncbi:MAG: GNAT family N-acetyltransferase [Ferruginibacter sp.]
MENIIIRKATTKDLPVLLTFEQGVIHAERPFDSTLKKGQTQYYNIEEMIAAAHIELLVAEFNSDIISSGYARIENSKPYLQHQQHAYLGFMYTLPQYRGKGINNMIIEVLKTWSLAQGITELRLDVYDGNAGAIKAYEKAGFARHMIEMRRGL